MVRIRIKGSEEVYWADANQLKPGEIKHPPFKGALKEKIKTIQNYLYEVDPHNYAFWENGFRRDQNPKIEIELWLKTAIIYKEITKNEINLERKKEMFILLSRCMISNIEN